MNPSIDTRPHPRKISIPIIRSGKVGLCGVSSTLGFPRSFSFIRTGQDGGYTPPPTSRGPSAFRLYTPSSAVMKCTPFYPLTPHSAFSIHRNETHYAFFPSLLVTTKSPELSVIHHLSSSPQSLYNSALPFFFLLLSPLSISNSRNLSIVPFRTHHPSSVKPSIFSNSFLSLPFTFLIE